MDLIVGKTAPLFVVMGLQMLVVFGAGALVFGYRINGSMPALVLLVTALVVCVLSYGVMLVAVFRTLDQAMVIGNLLGLLMAGLGGALAPAALLPGWAQALAHVTPTYWGLRGIRDVTLSGASVADVAGPLVVLVGFSAACIVVAALKFRPTDTKIGST